MTKSTTGLHRDQIEELFAMIRQATTEKEHAWPPVLGLLQSINITLIYLRRNRTQADLAETHHVSQPTISRAIAAITPLIATVLNDHVPTGDDLHDNAAYIVDGTLLPCWSWQDRPELYSGKHHTTGLNVQVATSLDGTLAWISDPIDGCHHDAYCLEASGIWDTLDPANWIGDKGYQGQGMATPIKKPVHRELYDTEKQFNKQINQIRYVIERTIAHIKNWRILHTDYRRPITTFPQTITAVIGLHFWATT